MQILRIASEYTDDALEKSGILARVNEARAERERRIEKALAALAPLGVRHADLARVVGDRVGATGRRSESAVDGSDA